MKNWFLEIDDDGFLYMTNKHDQGQELEVWHTGGAVYDYSKQPFIPPEVVEFLKNHDLKVSSKFQYPCN